MQTVGILLITLGAWITYCGLHGVPPWSTLTAVIRDPDNARRIVAKARDDGRVKYAAVLESMGGAGRLVGATVPGSNPYSGLKISADFAAHKARGSQGGIDYIAPVGTPIITPFSGVLRVTEGSGSGGNVATVLMPNGYQSQFLHLSRFAKESGAVVKAGDVIGYSGGAKGAKGSGSSTGPHIHWHMVDPFGTIIDPLEYLRQAATR